MCLLKIEGLELNADTINFVCLPDYMQAAPLDGHCFVGGWGTLASGGNSPSFLQSVDINIYEDSVCAADASYGGNFVSENEICAGKIEGGKETL
jgi:hypothetical protein